MFIEFKKFRRHEFDMTYLGKMRYFFGLEVLQRYDDVFISPKKYALEVLKQIGMDKSNNYVHNPIVPYCNQTLIHGRSKHINVCFHFLQELVKADIIKLVHCSTPK